MITVAATAEELRIAVHDKIVQAPTGEWRISVADVQAPPHSTRRVLDLNVFGAVTFGLRLEVAGEALAQLRPDQDLESWLLQKINSYLGFNPRINSGESRTLLVTEP